MALARFGGFTARSRGVCNVLSSPWSLAIAACALAVAALAPDAAATPNGDECEAQWTPTFGESAGVEINEPSDLGVLATAIFDDGSGPRLFVAGPFKSAGAHFCNSIAMFDGVSWSPLGGGLTNDGSADALHLSGPEIYDMVVFDDGSGPALYVAGQFTAAGGEPAAGIARWNGRAWSSVGGSLNNDAVALCVHDDGSGPALYVGGFFTLAGGTPVSRVAKWDGRSWSPVGTGMDKAVLALISFDDGHGPALFAGGIFTTAGDAPASLVAKWDGAGWSSVGDGFAPDPSYYFKVYRFLGVDDAFGQGPRLFACGGIWETASGVPTHGIAQWDGAEWSGVGGGTTEGPVWAMASFDPQDGTGPKLVAAGAFQGIGGEDIDIMAQWDGRSWSSFGGGSSEPIYALRAMPAMNGRPATLLAGGATWRMGDLGVRGIALFDGTDWHALGAGLSGGETGAVRSATHHDFGDGTAPDLVVGGRFLTASGRVVNGVARWDGAEWRPLGQGLLGIGSSGNVIVPEIRALASFDDGSGPALFAAGSFTANLEGPSISKLAKWNGESWVSVGAPPSSQMIHALVVFDDGTGPALYAGGNFTSIGGVSASRIARWDGRAWSPLGVGVDSAVSAMTVWDDGSGPALYVGGSFTSAGGEPASHIARWNGRSWSSLGSGVDDGITALAGSTDAFDQGPTLFVVGGFLTAGGAPANHVAQWNGSSWAPCGDGTAVATVVAHFDAHDGRGGQLYVGRSNTPNGTTSLLRWDGLTWSNAGAGLNSTEGFYVYLLHVDETTFADGASLLVGGTFAVSAAGDSNLTRLVACPLPCEADLTGDGVVDGADIAALLSEWGDPRKGRASADLNHDGIVNGADLSLVLGGWGACP